MSASRAEKTYQEAERKMKSFSFFGGGQKYETCYDLFTQASNQFKVAKQWQRAADSAVRAAECALKSNSQHDAASAYVNAANMFKKIDVDKAVFYLKNGIEYFVEEGRFSIAAKHQKEIAELYEKENNVEEAMTNYEAAADFYEGEGSNANADACLLKVAHMAAQLEDYPRAIEIFEKVASSAINNNLRQWSCKDYFFKSLICHLCVGDSIGTTRALDRYKDMDIRFSGTRECTFIEKLIEAVESSDIQAFTDATVEFDSVSKLDSWKTKLLLSVKETLEEDEEDDGLA